jgi:Pyruvate/2-oxoglutarate dehydrogenase complex, dihydrolipoamide dehydrogenase (E3) component, and related enzymes
VQIITVEKVLSAIGVKPNAENLGLEALGLN